MAKVISVVNLHNDGSFGELTKKRPVASVSFLGRYALIDFVLSNISNSNIDTVGVLIKEKPRSLFKHIGSGNYWNLNLKSGGLSLLYNEMYANNPHYNHDINNIIENIDFFKKSKADYVVFAPAHIITTMDYEEVVDQHEKLGSKVTMVYKELDTCDKDFIGEQYVEVHGNQIKKIHKNKGNFAKRNISLQTYVISMSYLEQIISRAQTISTFFTLQDILAYLCDEEVIHGYNYRGFARCFNSMESFFKTSLDFLDIDVFSQAFKSNWPIYTRTSDTPPSKYLESARVDRGIIANGAIINGTVENSVIGRNVIIGKGTVVKNSIIFTGTTICDGAYLENVIMDKNSKVEVCKELKGTASEPLYIKEGDNV